MLADANPFFSYCKRPGPFEPGNGSSSMDQSVSFFVGFAEERWLVGSSRYGMEDFSDCPRFEKQAVFVMLVLFYC
jgi:hypothetical protein